MSRECEREARSRQLIAVEFVHAVLGPRVVDQGEELLFGFGERGGVGRGGWSDAEHGDRCKGDDEGESFHGCLRTFAPGAVAGVACERTSAGRIGGKSG